MRNLILIRQLDDEGHNVVFNCRGWKITNGVMVIARGNKTGTLYVSSSFRTTIAVADAAVSYDLWHYRLGHMSEKGMKMLHYDGKL